MGVMAGALRRAALAVVAFALGCEAPAPGWTTPIDRLDRALLSVWGAGPDDLFVAGGGLGTVGKAAVLRGGRRGFTELDSGRDETLWWVWGSSPSDVWLTGERALVLHYDGSRFAPVPVTLAPDLAGATLYGIWGSGPEDVWAVGGTADDRGVVLRGSLSRGLEQVTDPVVAQSGALFKVWGAAADAIFLVGQRNTILRYDGQRFVPEAIPGPSTTTLFTVTGRSRDEAYAVGGTGGGVVLSWNGSAWSRLLQPALENVPGVAGVAVGKGGTLSLVGFAGLKLRGRPGALQNDATPVTTLDLHATFVDDAGVIWAVGSNYFAPPGTPRTGVLLRYGP